MLHNSNRIFFWSPGRKGRQGECMCRLETTGRGGRGGNHPGVPFLGNLGSEPPPHLQGAGAASGIWRVLSRWGRILPAWGGAPLPAPPAPLPMNWRGLRSRRTEEGPADAMTMEKAPHTCVEESGNSVFFFFKGKNVLDFLKPSLLKILPRMIKVRSSPGHINLKEQTYPPSVVSDGGADLVPVFWA